MKDCQKDDIYVRIAVVIPCYNSGQTIEDTLRNICNQTYPPAEIIVIDDGSTDDTEERSRRFPNVKYFKQKNSGVSVARNNGVKLARSDWIAFCDSDDVWDKRKLETYAQLIQEFTSCSFFFHDFYVFTAKGITIERGTKAHSKFFPIFRENKITISEILPKHTIKKFTYRDNTHTVCDIFYGNAFNALILGNFIMPSTVLIKKDIFLTLGGFDATFPVAEDTELFLRASKQIDFLYIDEPLAGYRYSGSGLTTDSSRLILHGLRAFEKNCLEDQVARLHFRKNVNGGAGKRYSRMSYYYITEYQRPEARQYAIRALGYNSFEKMAWLSLIVSYCPLSVLKLLRRVRGWWTRKTF